VAPEHCMYHLGFWGPQAQGLRACAQPLRPPPLSHIALRARAFLARKGGQQPAGCVASPRVAPAATGAGCLQLLCNASRPLRVASSRGAAGGGAARPQLRTRQASPAPSSEHLLLLARDRELGCVEGRDPGGGAGLRCHRGLQQGQVAGAWAAPRPRNHGACRHTSPTQPPTAQSHPLQVVLPPARSLLDPG